MKKIEIGLILAALTGILFKFLSIPGASLLFVLSCGLLAIFYFAFSLIIFNNIKLKEAFKKKTYLDIKPIKIIGTIGLGIGLSVLNVAIIFMIQRWPGGNVNMIGGLSILIIILIVALFRFLKTKSQFYIPIIKRIVLFSAFGIFLLFAPKYWILDIKYHNNPEFLKLIKEAYEHPENKELWKQVEEERMKMIMGEDSDRELD